MKKHVKELTEGMQRLCAVANRIVGSPEQAGRLEVDLLLERLRGLYEVALAMRESATPMSEGRMERPAASGEEQEDLHAMARMSAMAAMQPEGVTPQPAHSTARSGT